MIFNLSVDLLTFLYPRIRYVSLAIRFAMSQGQLSFSQKQLLHSQISALKKGLSFRLCTHILDEVQLFSDLNDLCRNIKLKFHFTQHPLTSNNTATFRKPSAWSPNGQSDVINVQQEAFFQD